MLDGGSDGFLGLRKKRRDWDSFDINRYERLLSSSPFGKVMKNIWKRSLHQMRCGSGGSGSGIGSDVWRKVTFSGLGLVPGYLRFITCKKFIFGSFCLIFEAFLDQSKVNCDGDRVGRAEGRGQVHLVHQMEHLSVEGGVVL